MKNTLTGLLLLVLVACISCDGAGGYSLAEDLSGFTDLPSGYSYKIISDVDGRKPVKGDVMLLDWTSIYNQDSVLAERKAANGFVLNPYVGPEKLLEIIQKCDEGDSLHIKMSLMNYALLTRMPIMRGMDTTKTVVIRLGIKEVENESTIIERRAKERPIREKAIIEKYLEEKGLEATESPDGIFQVVIEEGTGPKPQEGQCATVNYTVRLMDGTLIDTSDPEVAKAEDKFDGRRRYQPYTFTVGNDQVIPGWHKGVPLVNKGGKSTLVLPSALGYGTRGRQGIAPNTILVFDIEVVDIK